MISPICFLIKVSDLILLVGMTTIFTGSTIAQIHYPSIPAPQASGDAPDSIPNIHLSFDRPESWALKRFTAATVPSGIEPPASPELRRYWRGLAGARGGLAAYARRRTAARRL